MPVRSPAPVNAPAGTPVDRPANLQLVLFDLDGTLVDTAPDMVGALQDFAEARGLALPSAAALRPLVSEGATKLLQTLFDFSPADEQLQSHIAEHRRQYLQCYRARDHRQSLPFDGILPLLRRLKQRSVQWGVVTSKPACFAESLLARLQLEPACLFCPEHTTHAKPHPEPVQAALAQLNCPPEKAVFAGDHRRDLLCGRAAATTVAGCQWGYSLTAEDHALADFLAASPAELSAWLLAD